MRRLRLLMAAVIAVTGSVIGLAGSADAATTVVWRSTGCWTNESKTTTGTAYCEYEADAGNQIAGFVGLWDTTNPGNGLGTGPRKIFIQQFSGYTVDLVVYPSPTTASPNPSSIDYPVSTSGNLLYYPIDHVRGWVKGYSLGPSFMPH